MSASPSVQYVIDRRLVEEELDRARATLARGRGRLAARSFFRAAAIFYLIAITAQWSRFGNLDALPPAKRVALLLFPALAAMFVALMSLRSLAAQPLDAERKIREISDNLRSLGGAGWALRSLRAGVFMGAAIGIPVGLVMLLDWRPETFPVSSRWMVVPSFVGITLMWTIPFAFVLRWLSLLGLKRFVKAVPDRNG